MGGPGEDLEKDIGGVQGSEPEPEEEQAQPAPNFGGVDVEAPDAGEIEWAGSVVKKAPEPDAS